MNLHIVPDNTFSNTFYNNLTEIGLIKTNKVIVRSNHGTLMSIKHPLPAAKLYSARFSEIVGDTMQYEKVFIHYFTPLLYKWVATHDFRELNWMVWGGDLYNLSSLDDQCYEPITLQQYVKKDWSFKTKLYALKVWTTQQPYQQKAYAKVKNVLTWMREEYLYASTHLPLRADHKFFFYENQFPYNQLDALVMSDRKSERLRLIIGNSGSPTNNHLDAIAFLEQHKIEADLFLPVSYGDKRYINFLKRKATFKYGSISFMDRYMPFEEYLQFLSTADGLLMNTLRPQGYGNILMMMYLGKPVFFNAKNISLPDLTAAKIKWFSMEQIRSFEDVNSQSQNKEAVVNLFSHDRLVGEYGELFS